MMKVGGACQVRPPTCYYAGRRKSPLSRKPSEAAADCWVGSSRAGQGGALCAFGRPGAKGESGRCAAKEAIVSQREQSEKEEEKEKERAEEPTNERRSSCETAKRAQLNERGRRARGQENELEILPPHLIRLRAAHFVCVALCRLQELNFAL